MLEEPLLLFENKVCLFQVLIVVQQSAGEGLSVLRDSLGIEVSEVARKFPRIISGSGNGQSRMGRVDVNRRDVELELGSYLFQIEPTDPAGAFQAWDELERQRYPGAPFVLTQNELLALNGKSGDTLGRIAINNKRNG